MEPRFGPGGVALGLLTGAVVIPLLAVGALFGIANATRSAPVTFTLSALVGLALPIGLGVAGLRAASAGHRGFGLGLLLGWAFSTLVVLAVGTAVFSYVIRHAPG